MCNVPVSHHGHSHSSSHISCHGHSHSEQSLIVVDIVTGEQQNLKPNENINVRAAIIHVIGDFVQSIGVLLAAILIKFKVISFDSIFNSRSISFLSILARI